MAPARIVDCHAHIIDPARFPPGGARGYKPRPEETGTREDFAAVLDRHGVGCALLVQLSGYGTDNAILLDAMAFAPGRYKTIAVVDPQWDDRTFERLSAAGVVGTRFNLVSYDRDALVRPEAARLLARLKALGWFAQVYADDAQWPEVAAALRRSGVRALIDHFGVRELAGGTARAGFQAVLDLGRAGHATVKLSAPYRISTAPGFADLDPYVEALLPAFGIDGCVWGSDWPFVGVTKRPAYADTLASLSRWLPDPADRDRVLWRNPSRLFGFGA